MSDPLSVVTNVVQLVTSLGPFSKVIRWIHERRGRRKVSWGHVRTAVKRIIDSLDAEGWRPDLLVGVGNVGMLAAALVAENMNWRPPEARLTTANVRVQGGDSVLHGDFGEDHIKGKKLLIVDSEMYTGNTMRLVKQCLERYSPAQVKTAVLFEFKPLSPFKPDYCGAYLDHPVLFPWLFTSKALSNAIIVQKRHWGDGR